MTLIQDLPDLSINFNLDFPQAYLDVPVYIDIPLGMYFPCEKPRE